MTSDLLAIAGTVGLWDGGGGVGPSAGSGGLSASCALSQPRSLLVLAFGSEMTKLTPGP